MSNFQLPQTSFGPTANPLTAGRASVPGVSGSMGSGLSGAGKQKTIEEQIKEVAAQLATTAHNTPSYGALLQKLGSLIDLSKKSAPATAPGAPVDVGSAPVQGGGFGGGAAPTGKVIAGGSPQTPLELMRSLNPSDPRQQKMNEAILAAEATSDPTLRNALLSHAHSHAREMAHDAEMRAAALSRARFDERAARQKATTDAADADRRARWQARNPGGTDADYENYKRAAFIETSSAPQPGALDARAAVRAQGAAAQNAANRQANAFALNPNMPEAVTPSGQTREVQQAYVQSGLVPEVMRQAQARSAEMASPAYSHAANQMSHVKQMMDVKGMSPAAQDDILNKLRSGQLTLDEAMGFLQGDTSLDQYQADQTAALRNLGLTNLHPGLRPF